MGSLLSVYCCADKIRTLEYSPTSGLHWRCISNVMSMSLGLSVGMFVYKHLSATPCPTTKFYVCVVLWPWLSLVLTSCNILCALVLWLMSCFHVAACRYHNSIMQGLMSLLHGTGHFLSKYDESLVQHMQRGWSMWRNLALFSIVNMSVHLTKITVYLEASH